MDIANVGRFATTTDPRWARFSLLKWLEPSPRASAERATGPVGWNELMTGDWPRAFDFYAVLLGWEKREVVDMDDGEVYQVFSLDGQPLGGRFNEPSMTEAPARWVFQFAVADIERAVAQAGTGGGQVVKGPMQAGRGIAGGGEGAGATDRGQSAARGAHGQAPAAGGAECQARYAAGNVGGDAGPDARHAGSPRGGERVPGEAQTGVQGGLMHGGLRLGAGVRTGAPFVTDADPRAPRSAA